VLDKTIEQLYCRTDDMFLPDTYVVGGCPHCQNPDAQGDQCDQCGRLLDPLELVGPRCKLCGGAPEVRATRHLFLKLDELAPAVKAWIEGQEHWEGIIRNMPLGWIEEGLLPRAITRDLDWGVKVPRDGFEDKVFYVWFDAPIGYIAATAEWIDNGGGDGATLEDWWKGGRARLVHFMGKDNVPFHTIMWPSTLIAADDGWNLPAYIASNEYLTYEGGAFSKSRQRGVFSADVVEMGFPADAWRFYILSHRPERRDSDFSFEAFQSTVATDLVGNIGNLVNRVLSFVKKRFGVVPPLRDLTALDRETLAAADAKIAEIHSAYARFELRQAVTRVLELSDIGNKYFQASEPWRTFKEDLPACETSLHIACRIVHQLAEVCWPIMPERCETVLGWMGSSLGQEFEGGLELAKPRFLFQKIEDEVIAGLAETHRGNLEEAALAPLTFSKDPGVEWPCAILEFSDLSLRRKVKSITRWQRQVTGEIDIDALAAMPAVRAYDELLGERDRGECHSVGNLIDIVRRQGKLPNINSLVDVYNTWSLREGLVMGAYDRKTIAGTLFYVVADGTERFIPVKGRDPEPIVPGEWILKDEKNMVVTRVASKQSEIVAVSPSTTDCVICVQGNPQTSLAVLTETAEAMAADIVEKCGGRWRLVFAG
jgi:methionine--tRNA ligase